MSLNPEWIWVVAFVVAVLWAIGGTGFKWVRRYVVPVIFLITSWYWLGFSLGVILFPLSLALLARLPFTLIGDSIHEHWLNWLWIPIVLYLIGVPAAWIDLAAFKYALVTLFFSAPLAVLSNIKLTREIFPWKLVEGVIGIALTYPIARIITG